jgi:hypothetical protein
MDCKNAIVKYENIRVNVPNNKRLKLFIGKASVKKYWLAIVEIANRVNVILIRIGRSSR